MSPRPALILIPGLLCDATVWKEQIEAFASTHEVIVALGKFAAQTLLRSDVPITRLRGTWSSYQGVKLMPTFHPAYLLRSPDEKKKAQVWTLSRLGGEAQKLTDVAGGVSDYAWSPDSAQLVVTSRDVDPTAADDKPDRAPKPIEIETSLSRSETQSNRPVASNWASSRSGSSIKGRIAEW